MSLCPCCSGKEFSDCCEPILKGSQAPTPEAVMRARFSAYATANIDYLLESSCGPARKEFDRASVQQWAENSEWIDLEILSTTDAPAENELSYVEFIAHYKIREATYTHHERASFKKENDQWRFFDGKVIGPEPVRREEPKIGRNDPCPCGSGKKYKKCCGKADA